MNMKKLQEFLPFATGEQVLTDKIVGDVKDDHESVVALNTLGLIYWNKKENVVLLREKSKNMCKGTKAMNTFVPKFIDMELCVDIHDINRNVVSGLFSLEKIKGDDYSVVIDNSNGQPFMALKFMKDSRSPWVDVEGDSRDWDFSLTTNTFPNHEGFSSRYNGWEKEDGKLTYDGHTVSEFVGCIIHILEILGAKTPEVEIVKVEINFLQRKRFVQAMNFLGSFDDLEIEIVKEHGSLTGDIIHNETKIGTVSLGHGFNGGYRADVKIEAMPQGLTKNRVINAVNAAVLNPVA